MTHAHVDEPPKTRNDTTEKGRSGHSAGKHGHAYWRLLLMAMLSFAAMYVLMYAMVDRLANVYANVNQAYMAALMAAPMIAIELAVMGRMYPRKGLNAIVLATSAIVFVGAFLAIREQALVGDREFVRSMIPHHASAILMCEQAPIADAEIRQLCFGPQGIVEGQQREIDQMKAFLARG